MSLQPTTTTSLANVPAEVKDSGADGRKLYQAAVGFEQMLVRQLTGSLLSDQSQDDGSDDGSTGGGMGSGPYQSMMPDALAQSIQDNGGLGLAMEMWRSMRSDAKGSVAK